MTPRMDNSAAPEFHKEHVSVPSLGGVDIAGMAALGRITVRIPGEMGSLRPDAIMNPGGSPEPFHGYQLPLVGQIAVVAEGVGIHWDPW